MNKDKVQVVDDVMTRNEGGLEMGRDATRHMPVVRCAACCAITASPHPRICLYSSVIHICTRGVTGHPSGHRDRFGCVPPRFGCHVGSGAYSLFIVHSSLAPWLACS